MGDERARNLVRAVVGVVGLGLPAMCWAETGGSSATTRPVRETPPARTVPIDASSSNFSGGSSTATGSRTVTPHGDGSGGYSTDLTTTHTRPDGSTSTAHTQKDGSWQKQPDGSWAWQSAGTTTTDKGTGTFSRQGTVTPDGNGGGSFSADTQRKTAAGKEIDSHTDGTVTTTPDGKEIKSQTTYTGPDGKTATTDRDTTVTKNDDGTTTLHTEKTTTGPDGKQATSQRDTTVGKNSDGSTSVDSKASRTGPDGDSDGTADTPRRPDGGAASGAQGDGRAASARAERDGNDGGGRAGGGDRPARGERGGAGRGGHGGRGRR